MPPIAIVMNMFYTGLAIARSLGEKGIPVLGLTSRRRIYGNFTHYAKLRRSPDSSEQPEALLGFLLRMKDELRPGAVIFPTRDHDLLFLDRFREQLLPFFRLAIPESSVLRACLDKWETHLWAQKAGVPTPRSWLIKTGQDLQQIAEELVYPCVLKPVSAYDWRKNANWEIVGSRKAIAVSSWHELVAEYARVSRADPRVLLQEIVPGSDDCLVITGCYLDQQSNWVAGFNSRKLLQIPEGFGTGCIVQALDCPELFDPTIRLLQKMRFAGIAEVEYKWDVEEKEYKLIEINPRPWDQHALGKSCGADLIHLAYCEHAGLAMPVAEKKTSGKKWIAEDAFLIAALRLLWACNPAIRCLFRLARGKREYAIWSRRDPLPLILYAVTRFGPRLVEDAARAAWSALRRKIAPSTVPAEQGSRL